MGPEEDLLRQVKRALKQVSVPVYYDGHPHDADYPQVIIDLTNIQNQPHEFKAIERTKLTVAVDVYVDPTQTAQRLRLNNEIRNVMETVRCAHWWSDFDDYSERTMDDESYDGSSLKRTAFLFDYITQGIAIKKGGNE